ncbi:MAG: STAS domain-containing protein [Bryobacteraceae bacterium]|nr:STAS domain-containing protein [Bryobacteraceae bacterium]
MNDTDGPLEITIGGESTSELCAELREHLLGALRAGRGARVCLPEVNEPGLPLLQLLCSAHRTFLQEGLTVQLGQLSAAAAEVARIGGFGGNNTMCPYHVDDECLWRRSHGEDHPDGG